jgi:hypothetical protein
MEYHSKHVAAMTHWDNRPRDRSQKHSTILELRYAYIKQCPEAYSRLYMYVVKIMLTLQVLEVGLSSRYAAVKPSFLALQLCG